MRFANQVVRLLILFSVIGCSTSKMKYQHAPQQLHDREGGYAALTKNMEDTMAASGKFTITSTAFKDGEMIPQKYTCDGKDVSPFLKWEFLPAQTKSIALIVDDPDAPAGTWVHWVIFNIPPTINELPEGTPISSGLPNGALQGKNDFGNYGYGGPCPPGGTHRYYFKLYALDTMLKLSAGITKAELLKAVEGHVMAQAQVMGRYSRR